LEVYHWPESLLPRPRVKSRDFAAEMQTFADPVKFCAGKTDESRLPGFVYSGTSLPALYR
jgi:hypothetical protein